MRFLDVDLFEGMLLEAKVGREFQHLEDLVFVDGSAGAQKAVDYLRGVAQGKNKPAIKWDGNPTVYFGRNNNGEFRFVGKNAWLKGVELTTAREVEQFVLNTGKGEDWRADFAKGMRDMWAIFERATPQSMRGYLFCDILFHPGKPAELKDGRLEFTPNVVTYSVDPKSELGKRVKRARVCATAHKLYAEFGSKDGQPINDLGQFDHPDLFIVGQTYVPHTPKVDDNKLKQIDQAIQQHGDSIDQFLEPVPGLKSIAGIIYKFSNQMSKQGKHTELKNEFYKWIQDNVSQGQQAKIQAKTEANPQGSEWLFKIFEAIAEVKNSVIEQLDGAEQDLVARTGDQSGGEGYADPEHNVKLVPRSRWHPGM